MLLILINWFIVLLTSYTIGWFFQFSLKKIHYIENNYQVTSVVIFGLAFLTSYAQIFSLFYKVGLLAFTVVIIFSILIFIKYRYYLINDIKPLISNHKKLAFILFIAFLTAYISSTPAKHYDSYLYHCQAIHWIEEYGIVPGLGNLHCRLAYNSSWFSLQALFSFSFLNINPIHKLNGFLAFILICYSILTIKIFKQKKIHTSDFIKLGILLLYFDKAKYFSSPETDFPALALMLFSLSEYTSYIEDNNENDDKYIVISLVCIFTVSIKLSTLFLAVLAVRPIISLIKKKQWSTIIYFIVLCLIIFAPFLIRNVVISGYLIYPYYELDLFDFAWKIPEEIVKEDRIGIKTWAWVNGGLKNDNLAISEWFPIWKNNIGNYIYLFYFAAFSSFILLITDIKNILHKNSKYIVISISMISSLLLWFFGSPNYRYGKGILLAPILFLFGRILIKFNENSYIKHSMIVSFYLVCSLFVINELLYSTNTFEECGIQNIVLYESYYEKESKEIDYFNYSFYVPVDGDDQLDYNDFPSTPYQTNLNKIYIIDGKIENGFYPIQNLN